MPHEIKEVKGNRVTFEDPRHVKRAEIAARRAENKLTLEDIHDLLEMMLDAQEKK